MKRRDFVALGLGALGASLARAQQPGRQYRIGMLLVSSPARMSSNWLWNHFALACGSRAGSRARITL